MNKPVDVTSSFSPVTAGDIAVINLTSAREHSWSQFLREPLRPGVAERLIEQEHFASQFLGDCQSLDRLELLAHALSQADPLAARTALIRAQTAAAGHRFAEAREDLAKAREAGAPAAAVEHLAMSIDQACGVGLEALLQARRQKAELTRQLQDLVPLGALLADLGDYGEADRTYREALRSYHDASPFAVAWVCFQLGVLWGETASDPKLDDAAQWYRQAIEVLPAYVKARVHLAEIYIGWDQAEEAERILTPAISSGDPEVFWRLSDAMAAQHRGADADKLSQQASLGFESLLAKHLRAFADHGAEFYSGSGAKPARAYALARVNVANRPTLKAYAQAHRTAIDAGEPQAAEQMRAAAKEQWAWSAAFRHSPFAAP